ncbi:MAG TPA: GAF and ANTAR domain-containing protein [Euzebya sp.]|nr:GAF and ANTAR domain-containing protein [Euzebya sp.]
MTNTPDRQLLRVLVQFATTMVSDFTAEDALDDLVVEVPPILKVDGAGIMLEDDVGELRFIAASNSTIRLIEEFQVQTGEGPCVMAYENGAHVRADDLAQDNPFPAFAEAAMAAGLHAVHSFPMMLESVRVGALNLYRETTGPLPEQGVEIGQLFADIATSYLFSARRHDRLTRQIEGLRQAMQENGAVDQAKGVLMHTYGLQDREAFALLRRYARARRQRVLDVSQALMDGQLKPDELMVS